MKDLYIFSLIVVLPLFLKHFVLSFFVESVIASSSDVTLVLYGEMNMYTIPIIQIINKYNIPTMIAVENTTSIPTPFIEYVKKSNKYKFIPYVKSGTGKNIINAVSMLSNSSIIIHNSAAFQYDKKTVLRPTYFLPSKKYDEFRLMKKVWNDFKEKKIFGLTLCPFNNATYHYIEDFIHDIARFNLTINTSWYGM